MNPLLVPIIEKIIDRVAGSKKAKVSSVAGSSAIAATAMINPGVMLFPGDDERAMLANSILYVIGFLAVMYKEKQKRI